jgi:hypothetical protein
MVDSRLSEAGPAGGFDGGLHRADVVAGGVVHQGEAFDEAMVEHRPGGRVVAQVEQQLPDRSLSGRGRRLAATTGWMVDGPKAPITRRPPARLGWSRSSMVRTWESIAAASTAPEWTRRMARWWKPASTTRLKNPGRAPMRTRL